MSPEERAQPLACKPEMATLNCGTMNFGADIFVNSRPMIRDLARQIREAGSIAELECYEVGHIDEALALLKEGHIAEPLHFQFVLGVPGGIGAREDVVRFMVSQIPAGATWGVAAVGRHQRPMTELAIRLGGHARVGPSNDPLVARGIEAALVRAGRQDPRQEDRQRNAAEEEHEGVREPDSQEDGQRILQRLCKGGGPYAVGRRRGLVWQAKTGRTRAAIAYGRPRPTAHSRQRPRAYRPRSTREKSG